MESREIVEASKDQPNTTRSRLIWMVLLLPVLMASGLLCWPSLSTTPQPAQYASRETTFSGSSEKLGQTVVVPTLDSPMPAGRNVVWCSSFQLAWNELRDRGIGAPLDVRGAKEVAARLNAAKLSASDLDAKSVYVAGGWVEKGIRERIKKDMAARFPLHELPDFSSHDGGILSYSYLTAHVPFQYPFCQAAKGILFTDSEGTQTPVAGFGLWETGRPWDEKARDQVEILYLKSADERQPWMPTEYALDLCRHSELYQVVVARIEPKGSLAETLEYARSQMADFGKLPAYNKRLRRFSEMDKLHVPEMCWRIDHRFAELINQVIANSSPAMPIVEAFQTIEFRLDRSGASVESEAELTVRAVPRLFDFNRPFLVYMQKRGAERPFFVMWVANAELLVRK